MTAQRKRRGRKPATILRDLRGTVRLLFVVTAERGHGRGLPYLANALALVRELHVATQTGSR